MITATIRFNWERECLQINFFFHHDEGAGEAEADEKKHGEDLDEGLLRPVHGEHLDAGLLLQPVRGVLPQGLELKLTVDHHKDFEEGLAKVTEGVALRSKVDDVEGKGGVFDIQINRTY